MDSQDALRKAALEYIERHGSRHVWFSKQLGIGQTHWSLWLKGERMLADHRIETLKEILKIN